MFTWNYRIVNTKSENAGEDWYCLQEVCYDKKGKPTGYGKPCTGSEDMKSLKRVFKMMNEAMKLPPLQEEDFFSEARVTHENRMAINKLILEREQASDMKAFAILADQLPTFDQLENK